MTHPVPAGEREDAEIAKLLEAVFQQYGYDFRSYSLPSLRRRIRQLMIDERAGTVAALRDRVLQDAAVMERLLLALSINVSAMFRDPELYLTFRRKVVPLLRTYPFIRIWHAGCSTGEEVYSMAILLEEEGLYGRSRLYATDMNEGVLSTARAGIFPLRNMQRYTRNYLEAGGKRSFSEYYTANYDAAMFQASLKKNMVFAMHNLAVDGAFNEFHVIMCRNVLIYFNEDLQERVHDLFVQSLVRLGFLCLGNKETLDLSPVRDRYVELDARQRIYQRVR